MAPPTRTQSVLKNRALAAAYAGAGLFDVEVFEPETTRVLMAALLVHDLSVDTPPRNHLPENHPSKNHPPKNHPWLAEADQAVHGGLWRTAYSPRSALSLAALVGLPRCLGVSSRYVGETTLT